MKRKYNEIERGLLKINPMYKSAIDTFYKVDKKYIKEELYADYSGKENDLLIILYYRTVCKVYTECKKINNFRNFDDIVSSVTIKVTEYILSKNSITNASSKISVYVRTVMKELEPVVEAFIPLRQCKNMESNHSNIEDNYIESEIVDKMIDIVYNNLTTREQNILEDIAYGYTLREMGEKYNVTAGRISEIRNKAFRKIRFRMNKFLSEPIIKKSNKISSSTGAIFSVGKTSRTVDELKLLKYIESLDEIHEIDSDDNHLISTDTLRNKLFDSIAVGRFCLCNFNGKTDTLYKFYRAIPRVEGINEIYHIFATFCRNYYTGTIFYNSLYNNDKTYIEAILFHAFLSSVEFAIVNENAYAGMQMYDHMIALYGEHLSKYITVAEPVIGSNKYAIINYISIAMRNYKYSIIRFVDGKCFSYRDKLKDLLVKEKFYDKYTKFDKIVTLDNITTETIKFGINKIAAPGIIPTYSLYIQALEDGILSKNDMSNVLDFLVKNYIITKEMSAVILKDGGFNNER